MICTWCIPVISIDHAIRYNCAMAHALQWIKAHGRWIKPGVLVICAAAVGWSALFLRERAVRRLPLDHDERIYLYAARYYARSFQKGDLGRMLDTDINYEHPSFVKLVYGVVLYLRNPDLPSFEKEGFIIGERLLDTHPAKPMLLTARKVSAWAGTFSAVALALVNPLAGFFLGIHSFAVKYTSVAYLESIPMLTSLLSIWSFQAWSQRSARRKLRRDWAWLALSSLFLGLSVASKYIYAAVGIAIVGYTLFGIFSPWRGNSPAEVKEAAQGSKRARIARRLLPLLGWGILAVVVFFAADIYLWHDPLHRLQQSLAFNLSYSQNAYVQSMNYPFWQPFAWLARPVTQQDVWAIPHLPGDILVSLDTWIGLLALVGLPRLVLKRRLFAWWLVVGVAFLLLWSTKWPQYMMLILAPLCLSAAEGVVTLLVGLYMLLRRYAIPHLPKVPG